ncbi:D-aminopeptidase [Pseudooceanicola antarcticus]|uniref:D-aminopeptidase n=1 Tax=Pseudooceanicola antarcticus TaxID=1247613 RepID=A0A285HY01_9RHOB|nr:P1 family peptidase [Pseudooceanicola antarcticus]PJE30381.1 peptidase S58 family protein [Pseudooceanicola antarcticus]SNY40622.1 D-aminopeptidase [Pseudooceanicola antarcticus]
MQNVITDVEGLLVGQAQDDKVKTGVTVLTSDRPFTAAVHVMGGAPGTRETDLLAPDKTVQKVDALVLSGGSAFGLDAAGGVADALREEGRGFVAGPVRVPIVPSAILFDLVNGGDKDWTRNPYKALGREAYAARGTEVALGSHGAGTGAMTAGLKGGLGSASVRLPTGHVVAALVAVNALGTATVGAGRHFWAAPWEDGAEFGGLGLPASFPDPHHPVTKAELMGISKGNTTIGIIATDADIDQAQLTRLATAGHDGFARALVPSHTPADGDLIFGAATGAKPLSGEFDMLALCHAASVVMTRAIARGVHAATPAAGDPFPCWSEV